MALAARFIDQYSIVSMQTKISYFTEKLNKLVAAFELGKHRFDSAQRDKMQGEINTIKHQIGVLYWRYNNEPRPKKAYKM